MTSTFRQFMLLLALAGLLAACATDSSQSRGNPDEAVKTRVAAGLEYLRMGDPSEARRHFSRALAIQDDSAQAHNAMALLYNYEGDREKEEYHYKKALRADRHYSPALNNYGTLLYSQREYEDALTKFKRAANDSDYEGRASAYSNMGRCYQRLGRLDDAKTAFKRTLRINGRSVAASLELAKIYYQEDNHRLGWDYYEQYQDGIGRPSAEGLWVGIRLAAALDKRDQQSSYELALQNLYQGTREHRLWKDWRDSREGR